MPTPEPVLDRKRLMRALALGREERLIELMGQLGDLPPFEYLRKPQKGLVMVKAKADAHNAPFNLGEALATRCSLSVNGNLGHAYVLGDEPAKCLAAALADALAQDPKYRQAIVRIALALEDDLARERTAKLEAIQKTKVEFFTLVRGEDAD